MTSNNQSDKRWKNTELKFSFYFYLDFGFYVCLNQKAGVNIAEGEFTINANQAEVAKVDCNQTLIDNVIVYGAIERPSQGYIY